MSKQERVINIVMVQRARENCNRSSGRLWLVSLIVLQCFIKFIWFLIPGMN